MNDDDIFLICHRTWQAVVSGTLNNRMKHVNRNKKNSYETKSVWRLLICAKIEWFVAIKTFHPRKFLKNFVVDFLSYQQNLYNCPYLANSYNCPYPKVVKSPLKNSSIWIAIWINTKIERFVAIETSQPSKKLSKQFLDNLPSYQQNFYNYPYP